MKYLKTYAPVVLRTGMALVVLWFSLQQFMHTEAWTAYIPNSIVNITGLNATMLVYLNAIFEAIFGTLLLFGWQTRWVALFLALHMFDIMYTVGYGEIGARDFGLAIATFVVFMNGSDVWCLDYKDETASIPINFTPSIQKRII